MAASDSVFVTTLSKDVDMKLCNEELWSEIQRGNIPVIHLFLSSLWTDKFFSDA